MSCTTGDNLKDALVLQFFEFVENIPIAVIKHFQSIRVVFDPKISIFEHTRLVVFCELFYVMFGRFDFLIQVFKKGL